MNKLPDFKPVTREDMRAIWARYPDPEVRRLTLEIERYKRVMSEVDRLYRVIHQSWREATGGNLTALHVLQGIMLHERERAEL